MNRRGKLLLILDGFDEMGRALLILGEPRARALPCSNWPEN